MGIDYIKSYGDLQQELEDAKNTLFVLNDNIRRIVGKDLRNDKHKINYEGKRNEIERQGKSSDILKFKKRGHDTKSVFNRLSAQIRSGEEDVKPRLNSRVIRELPTRQEIVEAQGMDSESRARNRRMFGSLLGTLHKFCQEESRLKHKEDKKAQIEKKLEEQELLERETLKKERESLFMDRKNKQLEIRRLELKMSRLKDFEVWETSMTQLKHHMKTKSKPYLYFRPRIMSKKTEKLLSDHQASIDNLISKRRDKLHKELADLENTLKCHECDSEECIGNNDNCCAGDTRKQNVESKHESPQDQDVSGIAMRNTSPKGEMDFKENKSRNLNEPSLTSGVVVVKSNQKDPVEI